MQKKGPGMICPKCGAEQDPSPECIRCGLIFSKFRADPCPPLPGSGALHARTRNTWAALPWNRLLTGVLIAAGLLLVVSWFMKDRFPGREELLPDLLKEPVQKERNTAPFTVEAGDMVYTITPLFSYEIHGMVVSHHNCGAWWDIYHRDRWKDFINIKDLCMVWGENIETEVFREMKFSNDSWTCTCFWPNAEVGARFRMASLSNNHLLCTDDMLRERMLKTARGDQVRLRGTLAEYSHSGGTFRRGTSTRRTDTGNGACETIFVEDYEILKRANPAWKALYSLSGHVILGCLLLLTALFFLTLCRAGRG